MTNDTPSHQQNGIPEVILTQLSPGVSKEEQLWDLASKKVPRGWFLKLPSEFFLLAGLVVAIGLIFMALRSLDINNDESFSDVITSDFPKALGWSAIFMLTGWFHRWRLQIYDNAIEEEYQTLLTAYMEHHDNPTFEDASDSNQQIAEQLNLLRTDLTNSLQEQMIQLGEALSEFKAESASFSSVEIEKTLNRFSRGIQEIPEKIGRVIDSKMEEPTKDRADFRKAVSGFLNWPLDLNGLNGAIKKNTDQLSEATQKAHTNFEQMVTFVTHFDKATSLLNTTTEVMTNTGQKVDQFTTDFNTQLTNFGEIQHQISGNIQQMINDFGETQRQISGNIQEMINDIIGEVEKAMKRTNEQTVVSFNDLSNATDHLQKFLDTLTSQTRLQDERSQALFEKTIDRFDQETKRNAEALTKINDRIDSIPRIMHTIVDRVNDGVHLAIRDALDDEFKRDLSQAIAESIAIALKTQKRKWSFWPFTRKKR